MLWFDHALYVIENIILVITGNISLIIIINTVDIMQWFNKTNSFPIYAQNYSNARHREKKSEKPLSFFITRARAKRSHLKVNALCT